MDPKKRKIEDAVPNSSGDSKSSAPRATLYFPVTDDDDVLPTAAAVPALPIPASGYVSDDDFPEEADDIDSLLSSLSSDQVVSLLRQAAGRDPRIVSEASRLADADPAQRKLFVHGLGWHTTSDSLRATFSRYGEVEDCRIIVEKPTGRSKGYGFVLFRSRRAARHALRRPHKLIDGRGTSCQLASAGPTAANSSQNANSNPAHPENINRKLFVGKVHADIDPGRLRDFFAKFGEIEEGPFGLDRNTGKPKGYALFLFKSEETVRRILEEPNKNFEGHILECRPAADSKQKQGGSANSPLPHPALTPIADASSTMFPGVSMNSNGAVGTLGLGSPLAATDLGLAQQAAFLNQGLLGIGAPQSFVPGVQPNAALALLAAAGQNLAAFGITPNLLAALNPGFQALGSVAQPGAASVTAAQALPGQSYGTAALGYQNSAIQGPPGFQMAAYQAATGYPGPPGVQSSQTVPQQGTTGGSSAGTQNAAGGQVIMPPAYMSGYGQH